MTDTYLTLAEVGERAGLTLDSVRTYHKRATKNREAGDARPFDLPAPDLRLGTTPGWKEATIADWVERRDARAADGS